MSNAEFNEEQFELEKAELQGRIDDLEGVLRESRKWHREEYQSNANLDARIDELLEPPDKKFIREELARVEALTDQEALLEASGVVLAYDPDKPALAMRLHAMVRSDFQRALRAIGKVTEYAGVDVKRTYMWIGDLARAVLRGDQVVVERLYKEGGRPGEF